MLIVSKSLVPKGYAGMVVYPFIILSGKKYKKDAVFMNHERIHLRQQAELLVLPFFIWYGLEFVVRFMRHKDIASAYRNICFEREAYRNENDPLYLTKRRLWRFLEFV
jgi:hypothetical protein